VQHYQEEEQLMQRIAYPYSQEHRAQHSAMLQQAFDMVQQFQDARLEITDLARFLMHDLVAKHIQDEDRDFYAYLNSASACY
jgi:hemerythrin-like metal-binding protein